MNYEELPISRLVRMPIDTNNTEKKLPCLVRKKHYSSHGDYDISRLHKAVKREICIREATYANPIETDIIATGLLVTGNQIQDEGQHGLKKVTTIVHFRLCFPNEFKVTNIKARTKIFKE